MRLQALKYCLLYVPWQLPECHGTLDGPPQYRPQGLTKVLLGSFRNPFRQPVDQRNYVPGALETGRKRDAVLRIEHGCKRRFA
ncbi:MAG: hypothetical protein M5U09_01505 [Gammaproteobacteria bacterium]|nr:hypothetical protein [Gammaproteobacteria bacterium]